MLGSKRSENRRRNPRYLKWVRQQPCLVCGLAPSDAHHAGRRYMGRKPPDDTCVPLCRFHHMEYHSRGRHWWISHHGFDPNDKISETWGRYLESLQAVARTTRAPARENPQIKQI